MFEYEEQYNSVFSQINIILIVVYIDLDDTWFFNLICCRFVIAILKVFVLFCSFNIERRKKRASYGGQSVFFKALTDSENHGP